MKILDIGSEMMVADVEIWRPIKGYEGLYEVSNFGRVKRVSRDDSYLHKGGVTKVHYDEMMLKPSKNSGGYLFMFLRRDGKCSGKFLSKLVAEAFVENPNNYIWVKHKDEDVTNNRSDNLYWASSTN